MNQKVKSPVVKPLNLTLRGLKSIRQQRSIKESDTVPCVRSFNENGAQNLSQSRSDKKHSLDAFSFKQNVVESTPRLQSADDQAFGANFTEDQALGQTLSSRDQSKVLNMPASEQSLTSSFKRNLMQDMQTMCKMAEPVVKISREPSIDSDEKASKLEPVTLLYNSSSRNLTPNRQ